MKKALSWTLTAVLLALAVCTGILYFERMSLRSRLNDAEAKLAAVESELEELKEAGLRWELEKTRVGQSIGTVRIVLKDTLAELDKVGGSIGFQFDGDKAAEAEEERAGETEKPIAAETMAPRATLAPISLPAEEAKTDAPDDAKGEETAEAPDGVAGEDKAETAAGTSAPGETQAPEKKEGKGNDGPTPTPKPLVLTLAP